MAMSVSSSIVIHPTPNPNAHKFVLPHVRFARSQNFASVEAAAGDESGLAARLMALEGVYNVFWAQDFVTLNKRPDVEWDALEAAACAILREHFGLE